jgi:hypothetical protein
MPVESVNSVAYTSESPAARAARDFFTHSGHVPLVMLILEALLAKPGYFAGPDPYLLVVAGVFQAVVMELLAARGRPHPFAANLAGPALYSLDRDCAGRAPTSSSSGITRRTGGSRSASPRCNGRRRAGQNWLNRWCWPRACCARRYRW